MTDNRISFRRWLLSALPILGGALFAIGVAAERNAADSHASETVAHVESTEGATHTETASESGSEKVFGVNLESTGLVILAVVGSLVLALLVWQYNIRALLLVVLAFTLILAVLDIAEVRHQFNESRIGIGTLAIVITVAHLAAAAVAGRRLMDPAT